MINTETIRDTMKRLFEVYTRHTFEKDRD